MTTMPPSSPWPNRNAPAACRAAERLRAAGLPCEVVSIGSTPTALRAEQLRGVTEVRAGVYAMFDLVMHNVGVNTLMTSR
jgi:D-serine deaminase-like pyridoxal phosphate-dependent protein